MRRKLFSLYRTCYLNGITECVLRNSCRREGRCSRLARRSLRVRNAKQRLRNLSKAVGCKISKPSKASLIIVYIPILYMPYIPLFVYIPILYIDRETWKARARSPEPRVPVDISIGCIRAERVGPLTPDTRQVKAKSYTLNFLSLARSLARSPSRARSSTYSHVEELHDLDHLGKPALGIRSVLAKRMASKTCSRRIHEA